MEDYERDLFFKQLENYDYVSLTETICDSIQHLYDLNGEDYIEWNQMQSDEKATYVRLTKWAIDNDVDCIEFHEEWCEAMKQLGWKYLDDEEYNKYRRWDYRLKSWNDLDYEKKEFSKLYVALIYGLKELFMEE